VSPRYTRVIFDFDGTLADSFAFFLSVHNELARTHGFRAVAPDEVQALRRLGARDIMRKVGLPARKLPAVAKDFVVRMRANRSGIATFPGARELLVDLARAGLELAVVSSNSKENVEAILGPEASAAIRRFSCGVSIFGKRARLRKVLAASAGRPAKRSTSATSPPISRPRMRRASPASSGTSSASAPSTPSGRSATCGRCSCPVSAGRRRAGAAPGRTSRGSAGV
jgi:phosphoglycolate phosphatase